MIKINLRKIILSNLFVVLGALLIMIVGATINFPNANGVTLMAGNLLVEYDSGVFNISDVSIKYDDIWGPTMIGLIQNQDPVNTIEGVALSVQMYDKNNHLIGVMKGYPQSSNILPNQKTAFEIQSGEEDIKNVHHVFIEILASDWGTSSYTPQNENAGNFSTNRPFIGIIGLSLSPDLSKQIGLNQTKGFLLTNITKGSPAEKYGLKAGSKTISYNGSDVIVGGDIILKIDNREVTKNEDISSYIQSQKNIGDNVTLTVLSDNETRELDLILADSHNLVQPLDFSKTYQDGDSNYPDELYDECVSVAGKSFCDFLFKR